MLQTFLAMLAFCLLSNSAWTQTCVDTRHVDFRNATIHVGPPDENELRTTYNEPHPDAFTFHLRNGVALISYDDSPLKSAGPAWRAELLVDRTVHPDPSSWVRVLVIENDNLHGSSTWRYVLAFRCEKGNLVRLFQFCSEGVRLKHLESGTLQLYQAIWTSADFHTSPSKHREVSYRWDASEHQYRRAYASTPSDGAQWEPDERSATLGIR